MPIEFKKPGLLVVEGKDECNFFGKLLEHIGISAIVEIVSTEGKSNFKKYIPTIPIGTGFRNIEKIAVTRDADENAGNAFRSVAGILKKAGFKPPERPGEFSNGRPSVGVFIIPDNSSKGMLEDLCLESVKDHEAMKCVDDFIACTQDLKDRPKNIQKAKAQAFLAARPLIVNSIGLGAQKGYWNFNSEKLLPLIEFLKQLK